MNERETIKKAVFTLNFILRRLDKGFIFLIFRRKFYTAKFLFLQTVILITKIHLKKPALLTHKQLNVLSYK